MAACVAVNEQGKLVAEDLWNGFDEDFQEAVQKYFSEKWNMPKKEDVVSEIIEKAVPVPDNSAQDYSDVPVYYEPFSYAKENDEVDLYRTSCRLNSECKQAIHEAIADNYDGISAFCRGKIGRLLQSRRVLRSIPCPLRSRAGY